MCECASAAGTHTRYYRGSRLALGEAGPRGRGGLVLTRERSAAWPSYAAMPAAHALGLSFARLDAVLLHTERPVDLRTRVSVSAAQTGELLVISRHAVLSSFKQAYLVARR